MVRYERLGLGVTWNEKYGTVEDAEQFGWLIGYAPYHNAGHAARSVSKTIALFTDLWGFMAAEVGLAVAPTSG